MFLAAPGTHPLYPVCGDGYVNLIVLKFYYCAFTLDTLVSSALAIAITLGIAFYIADRLVPGVPGKLQMLLEFFVGYVRNTVLESVSEDATFIIPIAATIGMYILIANWIDFLPIGFSPLIKPANSDLNQTLAMAIVVILIVQGYSLGVLGIRGYLRRFTKPFEMNIGMRIALIPLNIIEEIVKPISLSLRLFGNIYAGLVMVYLITLVPQAYAWTLPISAAALALWKAFDVFFVGSIQAFIFMLLTIIYFQMAREGLEEDEHGAHVSHPGRASGEAAPAISRST
jgi:F-type H+-transporting ATPase subunit a